MRTGHWRIWIDTGGTFSDCLAVDPHGRIHRLKVLSSGIVRARVREADSERVCLEMGGRDCTFAVGMMCVASDGMVKRRVARVDGDVLVLESPWHDAARAMREGVSLVAGEEAPVLAARMLTGTPVGGVLPPMAMRLATTRGTNALLERAGSPVAMFVTRGHGDVLRIGTQQRPDLFALNVVSPEPLHAAVVEVDERLAADGDIVRALDEAAVREAAQRVLAGGVRAAAVALMHAWVNPAHEHRVAEILREMGFAHVSMSSDLSPTIGLRMRAETAVVNAYLSGPLDAYLRGIERAMDGKAPIAQAIESSPSVVSCETDGADDDKPSIACAIGSLHVLTSAGGLVRSRSFAPKDSLLSGPAGGVIGAAAAGKASGHDRVISFDMGGTSTDVARIDGEPALMFEHAVAGVHLATPAVAVHSVAAGGGSICRCERDSMRVGPESAGANPGPACYGQGGPMTITDANLLLGRFDAALASLPISVAAAEAACESLRRDVSPQKGYDVSRDDLLHGLIDLADERMAEAIREISIREGYDPAEYALVAFGGAGGQHACGVAARLGIKTVIVPRDAGLLSAVGLGRAHVERVAERQVLRPLHDLAALREIVESLEREAVAAVGAEDEAEVRIVRRIASLRLAGQETSLAIEFAALDDLGAAFDARYREVYGHERPAREVEVESLRTVARAAGVAPDITAPSPDHTIASPPADIGDSRPGAMPRLHRDALRPGERINGPALIVEPHCTTFVAKGWRCEVDSAGAIVLTCEAPASAALRPGVASGDLIVARLEAIGREMGEQLRRSAVSTNVKERLDYSCAILDAQGTLVISAPHVPVHLGALGECVRAVRRAITMRPGDVVVTNHPAFGGSHLPDITVITPVFDDQSRLIAHVASRAHHAEIGGIAPGSMPAQAVTLEEEGVVIPPMHLVRGGVEQYAALERVLRSARWPSRRIGDNLADVHAAVAANQRGARAIVALAETIGVEAFSATMSHLLSRAEFRVRLLIAGMNDCEARDTMDDGWPLAVRITGGRRVTFDFTGTDGVHPRGFNATPAIVTSAVMYILRLLIAEPMPLNEGLTRSVKLIIPRGMLNPDFSSSPAPAVAAGNTETSQRLVNLMLRALGITAESQGTMNNVLFGDSTFGYYETLGGGCGAGPWFNGASGVHSHMTNTRITDAEVLEHRYPVRVERFAIRRGSGGAGHWRGGDGLVRELLFLRPVTVSVITQRRTAGPRGIGDANDGAPGVNRIVRADRTSELFDHAATTDVGAGDRLVIETPGGGGAGRITPSA